MRYKRIIAGMLAALSLFLFAEVHNTVSAKGLFGNKSNKETDVTEEQVKSLKMYLPTVKLEPAGGISKKNLSVRGGDSGAEKLYDGSTDECYSPGSDASVTLDMGGSVLLSSVRYYAGAIDKNGGNDCLGMRFYASKDNKKYTELAVAEGAAPPENGWYEIGFSGFGEYRYFRAEIPAKSNVCELEWIGSENFSATKGRDGKYEIKLSLCAFDAAEDFDATVLIAAYNSKGIMKQANVFTQSLKAESANNFDAVLSGADYSEGDSYRVVVFDKNGGAALKNPLNYSVNGAACEFEVSTVFSDNMVLQADKPAVIWGKAPRGREVEVVMENDMGGSFRRSAMPGETSRWSIDLGSFSAGGSYTMRVKAGGVVKEYKNLTFGDVWLCTGQSNMEYYMASGDETAEELKRPDAVNRNIRLYNMWNKGIDGAAKPVDNPMLGCSWQTMDGDSAAYCSAVGYYFAREMQKTTNEPVGIVNVAVGDTEINRWIAQGTKCGSFTSTSGDLYNNRIYPLSKLAIKGIILYQGEADQYRTHLTAEKYSDAMAGLVDNYRMIWGKDLPFYWAQLTRYRVDESLVREGQRLALGKVDEKKNTGMIVLNDIVGNYDGGTGSCRNDIHPWRKKTVAERFAAYAKRDCCGGSGAVSGPSYKSMKTQNDELVITFECTGSLSVMPKERYADKETDNKIKKENIDTSKPMEFEVAGADGKFFPAEARIDGDKIILKSEKVSRPTDARYAWGAYPEMPNLTDDTGLPAATFTTEKGI